MGLVTLLIFPVPAFLVLYYVEGILPEQLLNLESLTAYNLGLGIELGILYAILALFLMNARVFKKMPSRIEQVVRNMKLSIWDCFFLSICAGVGEELLFRGGIQFYIGPLITALFFVAIHGYINPWNWRMSLYGAVVLPFILLISYGLEPFGIWFCIGAHFSYDLVLFLVMSKR